MPAANYSPGHSRILCDTSTLISVLGELWAYLGGEGHACGMACRPTAAMRCGSGLNTQQQ